MKPTRLLGIESHRRDAIREMQDILEIIGFKAVEVTIEDFKAIHAGFHIEPVSSMDHLFKNLPTEFILTERTQLLRVLLGAKDYTGAYVSIVRNVRQEFCGLVVTDLFWTRDLWCYATLYKNRQAGNEIRALLTPALDHWRKEFENLRLLSEL